MVEATLVQNDVIYLYFYLRDKDPISGSITYHNISGADTIWFRMRQYGQTVNTLSATCDILTGTLGYCRTFATIPAAGDYYGEIEVYEGSQRITWGDLIYHIFPDLG